jgi:diketogulonate reductase-like aldo/keto reductase
MSSAERAASPAILYGTAWKGERTAGLVERAIDLGFRGVDTACQPRHYDEAGVGRGIGACLARGLRRAELYVQTKFTPLGGQDPRRVPYDPRAPLPEQIEQSCAASLRNLGVGYLDAWLLHSPISPLADMLEAWQAMEAAVDSGAVRALGISNCDDPAVLAALWRAARIKPTIVQNRFHRKTGYDVGVRAFCTRHGLRYQSFWTLSANADVLRSAELRAMAERHHGSAEQVFLAYLTALGITPLTGTCSEEHMRDDLAIFRLSLSDTENAAIARLLGPR